jgi:3-oxoadipate enol-lactonase
MTAVIVGDNTRLAYRLDGPSDAPVVVLVNSLGTDYRMWEPQVPALAEQFRVLRFNTRGHGTSDVPPAPYTLDRLGQDVLDLFRALGVERAHICGLSLGGLIAQWLAIQHPGRVDRVVLANTAARIGDAATWSARIDAVRTGGMAAIRDAVVARFLSEGFRQRQPAVAARVAGMLDATPPEGYIGACAALRDADLRARVGGIRPPTLVIAGELDEATPPAQAEALRAAIPASRCLIIPNVAHLSNLEAPETFTRATLEHLIGA